MPEPLLESDLPNRSHRGKVRDTYDLGDNLLIVATDRISAFDHVLPTGIPRKGEVLTRLSAWWFERIATVVPHHFIALITAENAGSVPLPLDGGFTDAAAADAASGLSEAWGSAGSAGFTFSTGFTVFFSVFLRTVLFFSTCGCCSV